jgi:hypothetical protein
VQRYPEVLEYFYSLVDDMAVRDPPLSALSGARKQRQRATIEEARARTPGSSRRPGRGVPWASQGTGSGYTYAGPTY